MFVSQFCNSLLIFLWIAFSTRFAHASESEVPAIKKPNGFINFTTQIKPEEYEGWFNRPLLEYYRRFGIKFKSTIEEGNKTWIDSGGGSGVAVFEAARDYKIKGYVISLHNFELTEKVYGPTLLELKRDKRYNYFVGSSEELLPTFQIKADLLTDLFGAFTYSGQRMLLLDLYYNVLSENGHAFIHYMSGGISSVQTKSGAIVELSDYLINKYPKIFVFENDHVLKIIHDPEVPILDINKTLSLETVSCYEPVYQQVLPKIIYVEL